MRPSRATQYARFTGRQSHGCDWLCTRLPTTVSPTTPLHYIRRYTLFNWLEYSELYDRNTFGRLYILVAATGYPCATSHATARRPAIHEYTANMRFSNTACLLAALSSASRVLADKIEAEATMAVEEAPEYIDPDAGSFDLIDVYGNHLEYVFDDSLDR